MQMHKYLVSDYGITPIQKNHPEWDSELAFTNYERAIMFMFKCVCDRITTLEKGKK